MKNASAGEAFDPADAAGIRASDRVRSHRSVSELGFHRSESAWGSAGRGRRGCSSGTNPIILIPGTNFEFSKVIIIMTDQALIHVTDCRNRVDFSQEQGGFTRTVVNSDASETVRIRKDFNIPENDDTAFQRFLRRHRSGIRLDRSRQRSILR